MKGEKRGAAARRRNATTSQETPGEVLQKVAKAKPKQRGPLMKAFNRRYEVARIIHGESGAAADMRPKDIMLNISQYYAQAVFDWKQMMMKYAAIFPPTRESTDLTIHAEAMVDKYSAMAMDYSYRAGSFFDPKMVAVNVPPDASLNQDSITRDLLDEIDRRARNARVINPVKKIAG